MNLYVILFSGHESIIFLLSVIHISHLDHISLISSLLINLMLLPRNPFLDKKKSVAGLDLPNSSNPINVKLWSGLSKIILCKSVNVVE